MGGETQDVEVSALKKTGLDKLQEAILLQAEILDLKANPDRTRRGHGDRKPAGSRPRPGGDRAGAEGHAAPGRHRRRRRRMGPRARDAGRQGPHGERGRAVDAGGDPRPGRRAVGRRAVRGGGERKPRPRDHRVPRRASMRDKAAGVSAGGARHAGPDAGPHPGRRAEGSRRPDQGRRAGQRRGDPGHGAEAGARGSEGPRAARRRRADHRKRHPAGQGVGGGDRGVQRARHRAGARPGARARASISATTRSSTRSPTTSRSWSRARSRRRSARSSWATPRCARCSPSPRSARSPAAWSPTAW